MKSTLVGWLASSALILTACGGGGSTSTTTPPTTTNPPSNSAPVVSNANNDQTAIVGSEFSYDATQSGATFSDTDGDTLTYSITFDPDSNGISANGGELSGTPADDLTITVTITANDGNGGSATDSFNITAENAGIDQDAILATFNGVVNLESLDNYANQPVPNYITKLNEGGNPITNAGATLGRVLFYDKALSTDNTVSCASCHQQSHGFSDPAIVSEGVEGGLTARHSMRMINTMFADETNFFWDERASSHEDQETQPLVDHNEHGFSGVDGRPGFDDLVIKLEALEYYEELFTFAFGDSEITEERLQLALAQFTKSIFSFDSKFDDGRAQVGRNNVDFPNFTAEENAGKALFLAPPNQGGAGCQTCHRAPEFDIDPGTDHNGIFAVAGSSTEIDLTNTRAPSLRDVVSATGSSNGPFMHDGSLGTLLDVVNHYNSIQPPTTDPDLTNWRQTIDRRLLPGGQPQQLGLTDTEKSQLVAFLQTLSGNNIYEDPKWSDPFDPIPEPPTSEKPNIILVMTDDQGIEDSAQYNFTADLPNTPNFNALANSGIVFENTWVSPTCSPTRSALITGKYNIRTNVLAPGDPLPTDEIVLHDFLGTNADTSEYSSALIGKWHLGGGRNGPNNFGIDHFAGIINGAVGDYFDWTLNVNGTNTATTNYVTTELTNQAIDWVGQQTDPWFLWLAYNAPHDPFHLPPTDLHDRNLSGTADDIAANPRPYYLAAIEAVDTEFGRLWNSLSPEDQANTIVIFVGDNGTPRAVQASDASIRGGKGDLYQGGLSVPMFISGAGVTRSGATEDAIINHTDFFPTIVELAGGTLSTHEDGQSFVSLLDATNTEPRDFIYSESNDGWTIRNAQYKLIEFTDGSQELYDLSSDAQETTNLIGSGTDVSVIIDELESEAARIRQ